MNAILEIIKRRFAGFAFFHQHIGNKVFLAIVLSVAVSFLDGLGLSMFFPLLQAIDGSEAFSSADSLGGLQALVNGLQKLGFHLSLGNVLAFMIVFFILKGIAKYAEQVTLVIFRQSFIRNIRVRSIKLLEGLSYKSFVESDVGQIQNAMTGESDRLAEAFQTYFLSMQQGIMVVVYMSFAFYLDAKFAVLVCIGGVLSNFIYKTLYSKTKKASTNLANNTNKYQGEVIQYAANFKYLKASGSVSNYADRLIETVKGVEHERRKIGFLSGISTSIREPILIIIVAAVIVVQVKNFNAALGPILISLLFFYRALTALMVMQAYWNKYLEYSGSQKNVESFQNVLEENQEVIGEKAVNNFKKEIKMHEVSFSYGSKIVLDKINLSIDKNQSYAFVGESGSGKTTLVSIIIGLLRPSSGFVDIDGVDLLDIDMPTYQSKIGYVGQEAVIFNDTVFNNITFWAEKTKQNLRRFQDVIEQVSLGSFFLGLDKKEDTMLGNNGINLSGGQRQRISIARELYKKVDVLVLDEATSALDSETERAVQESIEVIQGQCTLIIIAHRLSTIKNVDHVVLMDKGRIVDKGDFEDLQCRQARFKKMVELQDL